MRQLRYTHKLHSLSELFDFLSLPVLSIIVSRTWLMFVHMISGFARFGDMANAIETYNEYKQLAISNNSGELAVVRKDTDVYAAMVRSYIISDDADGAAKFIAKLEATSPNAEYFVNLQDTIGLKGFLPEWLKS